MIYTEKATTKTTTTNAERTYSNEPDPTRRRFIHLRLSRSLSLAFVSIIIRRIRRDFFFFFFYLFHSFLGTKIELAIHEFLCRAAIVEPLTNDSIVLPLFITHTHTPNEIACCWYCYCHPPQSRTKSAIRIAGRGETDFFVSFSFMQNGLMPVNCWTRARKAIHFWIANPREM